MKYFKTKIVFNKNKVENMAHQISNGSLNADKPYLMKVH